MRNLHCWHRLKGVDAALYLRWWYPGASVNCEEKTREILEDTEIEKSLDGVCVSNDLYDLQDLRLFKR